MKSVIHLETPMIPIVKKSDEKGNAEEEQVVVVDKIVETPLTSSVPSSPKDSVNDENIDELNIDDDQSTTSSYANVPQHLLEEESDFARLRNSLTQNKISQDTLGNYPHTLTGDVVNFSELELESDF